MAAQKDINKSVPGECEGGYKATGMEEREGRGGQGSPCPLVPHTVVLGHARSGPSIL